MHIRWSRRRTVLVLATLGAVAALVLAFVAYRYVRPVVLRDDWCYPPPMTFGEYAATVGTYAAGLLLLVGLVALWSVVGRAGEWAAGLFVLATVTVAAIAVITYFGTNLRALFASSSNALGGFSTGGAKDTADFRAKISQGTMPRASDITYEGVFYDHSFSSGSKP
jgi:hypothetical protein